MESIIIQTQIICSWEYEHSLIACFVGAEERLHALTKRLDLPELRKTGVAFSTGHWHAGIKRFSNDLPGLTDTLEEEGKAHGGTGFLSMGLQYTCAYGLHKVFLVAAECWVPIGPTACPNGLYHPQHSHD